MEEQAKWYQDGLRFTCTQCGSCCSGAPGYVWVNAQEISAMAKELGLADEEFCQKYVRQVGIRRSLIEQPNYDCVFLDADTRHCLVYKARPIQCRTWPFWDSNLKSPETWESTCAVCPGSGKGKLYSIEHIENARNEKRL